MNRPDEFVTLFLRHQRRIFGFLLTVAPDAEFAEEAFQETSLILWRKADQFDPARDFVRWACGIAANVVRGLRSKRRCDRLTFDDDLIDRIADAQSQRADEFDGRRRALSNCLGRLDENDRGFLQTCYGPHGAIAALAAELGSAVNALHQRLHRLRRRLLECIRLTLAREADR